jgi:hypothetical protein
MLAVAPAETTYALFEVMPHVPACVVHEPPIDVVESALVNESS